MAKAVLPLLAVLCAVFASGGEGLRIAKDEKEVPLYHPYAVTLASSAHYHNPWTDSSANVTFTPPKGRPLTVGAFFRGEGQWEARVAPNVEGHWTWTTSSADAALAAHKGSFEVVANNASAVHGVLRVDEKHPHHFVYDDGSRYFMMAYECDWLWALGLENETTPTPLGSFLDSLAFGGYNQVLLNFYANYSSWNHNQPRPFFVGKTRNTPWASADQLQLNPTFWDHYDDVMLAMQERGIVAHIMITVWNKNVNWPAHLSQADLLYWRTIINRYQAFSNVIWDISKEAWREDDSYWDAIMPLLIKLDAHQHPRTLHSQWGKQTALKANYSQLISDQQHGDYYDQIRSSRDQFALPVANVEFLYEMGSVHTYGPQSQAEDMRPVLWSIYMAGGYAAWYIGTTAWDVIIPGFVSPGYSYCRNLVVFFTTMTEYWTLSPMDNVTSVGFALGLPEQEYIIYVNKTTDIHAQVASHRGLSGSWFDPRSGQSFAIDGTFKTGNHTFSPPSEVAGGDAVLHLFTS